MQPIRLISWAYVLALLPLFTGSFFFFYWYYQRNWFAVDADIITGAVVSFVMYIVLGLASIILCIIAVVKRRAHFIQALGPLTILAVTVIAIDLYHGYHYSDDRAYLRVDVRGSEITEVSIWSTHFHQGVRKNPATHPLTFKFHPVYTYDWGVSLSGVGFPFTIDSVFLEVHEKGAIQTYVLPELLKGECLKLSANEIDQLHQAKNMIEIYGDPQKNF